MGISGVRSKVALIISHIRGLISPRITIHEPPSTRLGLWTRFLCVSLSPLFRLCLYPHLCTCAVPVRILVHTPKNFPNHPSPSKLTTVGAWYANPRSCLG